MRKSKAPAKRKPRKKRAKALRAAGVASLLLAGVAPAGASGASADIPQGNFAAPIVLSDEEIIEHGSLSTFTVDKENVGSLRLQQEVKNGSSSSAPRGSYCGSCYGCRSCRCYYCRSCRCTRS
jgi:hypothetical protein